MQTFTLVTTAAVAAGCYVLLQRWRRRQQRLKGTLWAMPISLCSRRVLAALEETAADYTVRPVNLFKGEQNSASVRAVQPFGKVPAWVGADGLTMFESRAIMRLAGEGSHLVPSGRMERALMETWISVEYSYVYPPLVTIFRMRVLKKLPLDEVRCVELTAELAAALDVMEARLSECGGRSFLACERFTLADLTYLPSFAVFVPCGLDHLLDSRPALKAWWERCSARASWRRVTDAHAMKAKEETPENSESNVKH